MSEELFNEDFDPLYFFSGCHAQTIVGTLTSFYRAPRSTCIKVRLPDKDYITIELCCPKSWKENDPTIIFVHGLCGSHKSNYLQRLAKKFYKKGIQTARINLRGCGSSRGLAKYVYHSGSSEDVHYALNELRERFPKSSFTLVGFSLGGNIVLKLAAELGEAANLLLKNVIAVCPPIDLKNSVHLISSPHNQMYEKYFIRLLRQDVHYRHKKFNLPEVNLPKNMTIFEFDEYYIAPQIGYKSALEYYEKCSSKKVLHEIKTPTQILFAKDDPIIDCNLEELENLPSHIQVVRTSFGGHLGFLARPFCDHGYRWMDYILLKWVDKHNKKQG